MDSDNALYCHELTTTCYADLGSQKSQTRILSIKVKPRYLANSFLDCEKFHKVVEIK